MDSYVIKTENGDYEIDTEDCWIRNHMMGGKVFEHHIINGPIKEFVQKSKYIVDVGANIGCHTISYALMNQEAQIWAFEPQQKLFGILSRNSVRNQLSPDRVKLFNCCLGHTHMNCEMSPLETTDKDYNNGGCNKAGLGIGQGGEKTSMMSLDSLNLPGLDFIKIDV